MSTWRTHSATRCCGRPVSGLKDGAECDFRLKVEVTEPRIFAPLKGSNTAVGFAKIKNNCAEPVDLSLISAEGFKVVPRIEKLSQTKGE